MSFEDLEPYAIGLHYRWTNALGNSASLMRRDTECSNEQVTYKDLVTCERFEMLLRNVSVFVFEYSIPDILQSKHPRAGLGVVTRLQFRTKWTIGY